MSAITLTEPAESVVPGGLPGERGKPIGTFAGMPLYKFGTAPAHLRSRWQLELWARRKPAPGQLPVCYVNPYGHPVEPCALYDPSTTVPIAAETIGTLWERRQRRTCPRCGEVREAVVRGKQCGKCRRGDLRRARELAERTCEECRRVGKKPYPLTVEGWRSKRLCRFCVAARKRKLDALLAEAVMCPGGCGKRTAAKKAVLAWAKANYRSVPSWPRKHCPPCGEAHRIEQERLTAKREARWAKERAEQAERDRQARAAEVAELAAWARDALADPNVVILDTETTGLGDDARIVDIAVATGSGEVLLDTLVNPGEPIPCEATDIHGITDEMVAGAPTFTGIAGQLAAVLAGRRVIIYNKTYDVGILAFELRRLFADAGDGREALVAAWMAQAGFEDAMEPYSDWVGEWNDYHGNYRWQRLNGGHRALGDCLAVIECLHAMARSASADEEEWAA